MASKLTPIASGTPSSRPTSPPPGSALSRPGTSDPTTQSDRDSAYSMRNVPIRMYLPDGPVLQELAPPILEDGALSDAFLSLTKLKAFIRHAEHSTRFYI